MTTCQSPRSTPDPCLSPREVTPYGRCPESTWTPPSLQSRASAAISRHAKAPTKIDASRNKAPQAALTQFGLGSGGSRAASALEAGGHGLVLARELHAGGERHGLHQRREILLQVFFRIRLPHPAPEIPPQ